MNDDSKHAKEIWARFDVPKPDFPALARDEEWLMDAASYAADWQTCACGQMVPKQLTHEDGEPIDERLKTWGVEFLGDLLGARTAQQYERWDEAEECIGIAFDNWVRIERRTAELLTQKKGEVK